jgi:hypothetical protein
MDEIAVRTYLIEDALRHQDRELAFERHRQLDQVERIGGQIFTQGDVGNELLDSHAEMLGDQKSNMRFHEFVKAGSPQARGDPSRGMAAQVRQSATG